MHSYQISSKSEKDELRDAPDFSDIDAIPRGSFLFATGFTDKTTREDIRASLKEYTNNVKYLDYSKGKPEGYVRLSIPFSNKDLLEKIDGKLKVKGADITLRLVEGEEEDTQIKKAEMAISKGFTKSKSKRKRKFGGGMGFESQKRGRY